MAREDPHAWEPWALWMGGLMPGASLLVRGLTKDLGPDPINTGLNGCGEIAIKLLLLCLSCTPIRILWKAAGPFVMRARKHLGLLAFTYACAHFCVYIGLDRAWELGTFFEDLAKRPFILVGMAALTLLIPLALTSSKWAIRKLGGRNWGRLHKLVYAVAILAVIHFIMRAKKDTTEAMLHGAFLALLFAVRAYEYIRRRTAGARRAVAT